MRIRVCQPDRSLFISHTMFDQRDSVRNEDYCRILHSNVNTLVNRRKYGSSSGHTYTQKDRLNSVLCTEKGYRISKSCCLRLSSDYCIPRLRYPTIRKTINKLIGNDRLRPSISARAANKTKNSPLEAIDNYRK